MLGVGARALGMGGAFLARADDATAASWNPAGLSYLRRPEVSVVGDYLTTRSSLRSGLAVDSTTFDLQNLDFVAVTYPLSIRGAAGSIQASYQRAIPFDSSRETVTETTLPGAPEITNVRTYDNSGGFDVLAFGFGFKATQSSGWGAP